MKVHVNGGGLFVSDWAKSVGAQSTGQVEVTEEQYQLMKDFRAKWVDGQGVVLTDQFVVPSSQEPETRLGVYGSVSARFMKRDHHAKDGSTPRRNRVHSVEADEELGLAGEFQCLVQQANLMDGDEFEVCVTPTGRRPHGDRWFLFPTHRPETDEEVLRRIEGTSLEESNRTALGTKLEGDGNGDKE